MQLKGKKNVVETREWSPGIFLAFVGLPTHAKTGTGYERLVPQPFKFITY
jgi:hypothetical protein